MDSRSPCCKVKEDMAVLEILRGFGTLPAVSVRRPGETGETVLFNSVPGTALNEVNKRHFWNGFFLLKITGKRAARSETRRALQREKGCRNAFSEQMCQ